jgi:hypothetical protein
MAAILFSDSLQAPRFITQPSASGSIVAEGRTKILQCQALGNMLEATMRCRHYTFEHMSAVERGWAVVGTRTPHPNTII